MLRLSAKHTAEMEKKKKQERETEQETGRAREMARRADLKWESETLYWYQDRWLETLISC